MLAKGSITVIFIGLNEALILEKILADLVFFLFQKKLKNLEDRLELERGVSLHFSEVGPRGRFYIELRVAGTDQKFTTISFGLFEAVKPSFILEYLTSRLSQLVSVQGYRLIGSSVQFRETTEQDTFLTPRPDGDAWILIRVTKRV